MMTVSVSLFGTMFTDSPIPEPGPVLVGVIAPSPDPVPAPVTDVGGSDVSRGRGTGTAKLFLKCLGAACMASAMEPVPMLPEVLLQG